MLARACKRLSQECLLDRRRSAVLPYESSQPAVAVQIAAICATTSLRLNLTPSELPVANQRFLSAAPSETSANSISRSSKPSAQNIPSSAAAIDSPRSPARGLQQANRSCDGRPGSLADPTDSNLPAEAMPVAESSQPQSQSQRRQGRGHHGQRRGRGGRGRGALSSHNPSGGNVPAEHLSVPDAAPTQSHQQEAASEGRLDTRRGRDRRGRGQPPGGRASGAHGYQRPAPYRAFGGHLTTDTDETGSAVPALSGDAPEFVPGQPVASRRRPRDRISGPPTAKLPKSTAADLGTRIHEDIGNWNYECAICTDDVIRTSQVWSCTVCWTVVHLKCARRWHDNQKKQADLQSPEPQAELSWRCPGCNSKLLDAPGSYHCCHASAENPLPKSSAERRITKTAGAARRPAETCCPAASTFATDLATPGSAETAKTGSMRGVIAAASRGNCPATSGRNLVRHTARRRRAGSKAPSSARMRAGEASTVALTRVPKPAILGTSSRRTVPSPPTWSRIAPAARHLSVNCWSSLGSPAKTASRAVKGPAKSLFRAATCAGRLATRGPAASATSRSRYPAGAAGQAPARCAIKESFNTLFA
ncbi:hypothetical protein CDD83_358 [Cordyceps sp. RAO-2017]|nr:hypothetical protein CDD83_358 [Cordyceps sp. RAO-2017]